MLNHNYAINEALKHNSNTNFLENSGSKPWKYESPELALAYPVRKDPQVLSEGR